MTIAALLCARFGVVRTAAIAVSCARAVEIQIIGHLGHRLRGQLSGRAPGRGEQLEAGVRGGGDLLRERLFLRVGEPPRGEELGPCPALSRSAARRARWGCE